MDGLQEIRLARLRHIGQGYTEEHDQEHDRDELAFAAATYALPFPYSRGAGLWPWETEIWLKHRTDRDSTVDDRIHELAEAGALIAAEIDRLRKKDRESA